MVEVTPKLPTDDDLAFAKDLRAAFSDTHAAHLLRQYVNVAVIAERERNAGICDASAKQWRDFASMGLPAMPDPAVCRVFAKNAEELAQAIRDATDD